MTENKQNMEKLKNFRQEKNPGKHRKQTKYIERRKHCVLNQLKSYRSGR